MIRASRVCAVFLLILAASTSVLADTMPPREFIAREGKGYLENVGSQPVLHLKGTPEEMGRQHGVLLRSRIESLVSIIQRKGDKELGPVGDATFDMIWRRQTPYIPERYVVELKALAEASGVPYDTIRRANTIPEMFHCSGFAVFGKAVKDGNLYHGRILDYGVEMGLQDHCVVIIAEPDGMLPFVNVGYAGFVGSVTGMNMSGVGFGEMGGRGLGKWDGTPMAFLMRRGLEESGSLAQARKLFSDTRRTCEYYYVLSDSNIPWALGVAATPEKIEFVGPNQAKREIKVAIRDAVVISAGDRYDLLAKRIKEKWGKLDAAGCMELMRRPVSMSDCLHCALMSPGTGEIWIAHATTDGKPASEQPYVYLDIKELMRKLPDIKQ